MNPKAKNLNYGGVMTAIATPFDGGGLIDWPAFERLIKAQLKAKVAGIIVHGTTGEAATLSVQEKLSLTKRCAAIAKGSAKIMAGSGGMDTQQSMDLSYLSLEAGADSLLVVTPPYVKPNESGLILHYEMIAKRCNAPICLYHVPGRTGQKLGLSTLNKVLKIEAITMVKEASGDICYFSNAARSSDKIFLSGDDPTFLPSLSVGGKGCISVVSNIFPKAMVALYDAFFAKDIEQALKIHRILGDFSEMVFCETNPTPLKFLLAKLGYGSSYMRPPLGPISEANEKLLWACYEKTRAQLLQLDLLDEV